MISSKFLLYPVCLAFPSAPVELHNTATVEVAFRAGHILQYPPAQITVPEVCITLLLGNYGFFLMSKLHTKVQQEYFKTFATVLSLALFLKDILRDSSSSKMERKVL